MRPFLHALKWILLTLLAIPLSIYLILLLINIRDVSPSEQSKHYLAQIAEIDRTLAKNQINNAYIFALGFGSAKGEQPMIRGLEHLQQLQTKDILSTDNTQQNQRNSPLELPLKNCLGEAGFLAICTNNIKQNGNLKIQLSNNNWLIERYQQMLQMSIWQDSPHLNADISALPFKELLVAQKLYLLDIYQNLDTTTPKLTAKAIEQDLMFWQQLSINTNILINKMVSSGAISVNMKLGEVILAQQRQEQDNLVLPSSWTKPMPADVLSINKVKLGEWYYFTRVTNAALVDDGIDTMTKIVTSLLHPFMQYQDTANRYAAILVDSNSQLDCQSSLSIDTISSYIYNPIGKYILCTGVPSFNAYQMTLDKLEQQRQALITRLKKQ